VTASYSFDVAVTSPIILDANDRLIVKIIAYISGGGSAPTIVLDIQNQTAARFEFPAYVTPNITVRGFGFGGTTIPSSSSALPVIITSSANIVKVKAYGIGISGIWQFGLFKNGTLFHTISITSSAVVSEAIVESVLEDDILTCVVSYAGTPSGSDFVITLELN
jgi:hypothetical protein